MTKLEKIIADIRDHVDECGMTILTSDDPANQNLGWICLGCQARWDYPLATFKIESHLAPEWLRGALTDVPSGRLRLARYLSKGARCLVVWDEWDEYDIHDCAADVFKAFGQALMSMDGKVVPLDERPV